MQVRFLESAQSELDEAIDYYNAQAPHLGQGLLIEVMASLDRICHYPDAWHLISKNTRRCQLKRFPYGVIYTKLDDSILVIAIGHLHRNPVYWQNLRVRYLK